MEKNTGKINILALVTKYMFSLEESTIPHPIRALRITLK